MTEKDADDQIESYVRKLSLASGVIVPRVSVSINDWKPDPKACHANAATWCELNPECEVVHGWLYFDQRFDEQIAALLGLKPHQDLVAHSVIRDPKNGLIDVTPVILLAGGEGKYPFVSHVGTSDEFEQLITNYNLCRIRLYGSTTTTKITYLDV